MAGISVYKRNQGQVTRSVTAIALAVIVAAVCYYIHTRLIDHVPASKSDRRSVTEFSDQYELAAPYSVGGVELYGKGTALTDDVRRRIVDLDPTPGAAPKVDARLTNAFPWAIHVQFGVPIAMFAAAAYGIFRLVNHAKFADFLIATESEMKKVSWSSRAELVGSTIVVIVTVVVMALYIFGVDAVIMSGLKWFGIIPSAS